MGVVTTLVAYELRRRWRSAAVMVVFVAVVGAIVITALAGARRTESAFDRFAAATDAADVEIEVSQPGVDECEQASAFDDFDFVARERRDIDLVRSRAGVVGAGSIAVFAMRPVGTAVQPLVDFKAAAPVDEGSVVQVDRPIVLEGRLPDPDDAREAALNEAAAARLGLGVGDTLRLESLTPSQFAAAACLFSGTIDDAPRGPTRDVRIVGVARTRRDVASDAMVGPVLMLTPAFYARDDNRIGHFMATSVRLREGSAAAPQLIADLRSAGARRAEIVSIMESGGVGSGQIDDALTLQARALLLLALCVAVPGVVAVAQGTARVLRRDPDDEAALRALGVDTRARVAPLVVLAGVTAVLGGALSVALAYLASGLLPTGLGERAEPNPGRTFDASVLPPTAAGLALVIVAVTAALLVRASRSAPANRRRVASTTARRGLAPAARSAVGLVGSRLALDRGSGRSALPVRSALVGAGAAVAGVVSVLTLGACLHHLLDTPSLYGWTFDLDAGGGTDTDAVAARAEALARDRATSDVAIGRFVDDLRLGGIQTSALALEVVEGTIEPTVLSGRLPRDETEIMLGPRTADRLDVAIGDSVGSVEVVGIGLVPLIDADRHDEGAVLTPAGLERLPSGPGFEEVLARFGPSTDVDAEIAALQAHGQGGFRVTVPADVTNLGDVEGLPDVLAAVLAVVGTAAIAQATWLVVVRRRRYLAVLRALGFRRGQLVGTVLLQALTITAIGAAAGTLVGLALGRWVWTLLASELVVVLDVRVPWGAIVATVVGALAVATAVAVVPARRASAIRTAAALRAE
jgi:ABC-type lipoprotein release transport system permease subunit